MSLHLVTGIAGFIGSSIAKALIERGESVRGIDNFVTGSYENVAALAGDIDLREGDITDARVLRQSMEGVSYVLHQAALASVPRSLRDPQTSHEANVNGTLNVLLAARDARVRRVVFAASSSAYGDQPVQPKTEDMMPCPLSPYAVQKLASEQYMQVFWRNYGLQTVCLRYFNVFGPHQSADSPYSGVIARFIRAMLRGERPVIFGDGSHTRDFTYVANAVSANLLACTAPAGSVCGQVFNIGTGLAHSLNQTFRTIAEIIGFPHAPIYLQEREGDICHSLASIARARKCLGYEPRVSFIEGLRRTIDWYRDREEATADLAVGASVSA